MFGPPGTIYVFLSYGVHYLLNFVCDRPQVGAAVLIRAFQALEDPGERSAAGPAARRGTAGSATQRAAAGVFACGPGRVEKHSQSTQGLTDCRWAKPRECS